MKWKGQGGEETVRDTAAENEAAKGAAGDTESETAVSSSALLLADDAADAAASAEAPEDGAAVMEVAIPEEVIEALEVAVLNCRLTFTALFAGLLTALCKQWAEGMLL